MKKSILNVHPYYVLGLVIFVAIVAYFFINATRKKVKDVKDDNRERREDEIIENTPAADGTIQRSKKTDELAQIANIQHQAMKGGGTNPVQIINSLKLLNGEDLKELFKQFGYRNYRDWDDWTGTSLNLFGWYEEEFGDNDYVVNLRRIWAKSGLKITF